MGLFKRMSDIVTANLNEMAEMYEDPEKMLKQAVREMESSIEEARRDVARSMASDKVVATQLAEKRAAGQPFGIRGRKRPWRLATINWPARRRRPQAGI